MLLYMCAAAESEQGIEQEKPHPQRVLCKVAPKVFFIAAVLVFTFTVTSKECVNMIMVILFMPLLMQLCC